MPEFKRDCKSFREDYACDTMTAENLEDCSSCLFYEPIEKKILLIKIGALGDVIRTTPILSALKKKYGHNIHITWLVGEGEGKDILKNNPNIDRILEYNFQNVLRLKYEKFNVLINLDIDSKATLVSNTIKADEKYGYYFNEDSFPSCFNKASEYYLNRVFSNYSNKINRKTYQQMMFDIAELPFNKEEITIHNYDDSYAKEFMKKNNLTKEDKIICINLGSGGRWPSKAWHQNNVIDLIKKLKEKNYKVLLRGGPNEKQILSEIIDKVNKEGIKGILTNYPDILSIPQLSSLLDICDLIIAADTFVLHLATALKKKTIALFFCTPPWEIEDYGIIKKMVSPLLEKHFYTDFYIEELTKSISAEEVFKECQNLLE